MPEPIKPGEQGVQSAGGQVGHGNAQEGEAGTQGEGKPVKHETYIGVMDDLKKAERNNKALQAKLDKIEADQKKADEEKLKADGKLQELVTAKEKDIAAKTERIHRAELKTAAIKAGLVDMDYVDILIKSVQFNDQDEPEGLEELFKDLQEKKPYLFKQPENSAAGTFIGAASWKGGHTITEAEFVAMTPADREKAWPEVKRLMDAGLYK